VHEKNSRAPEKGFAGVVFVFDVSPTLESAVRKRQEGILKVLLS